MTTRVVELGGETAPRTVPWPVHLGGVRAKGQPAVVHPGRPVTMGPAVCQGCGLLVWWSGALWSNADGSWHRCAR